MGRLTNSTLTASTNATPLTVGYSYDANGNRVLAENGSQGSVINYQVDDQDRLLSLTPVSGFPSQVSYAYDLSGNLTSVTSVSSVVNYSYDSFGSLLAADLNGTNIAYTVDPLNRRIGKSVNGTPVQKFIYQNQINPVAALDGSNNIVSVFVYGNKGNVPAYMVKEGATYRIVSDQVGSVRLVVNTTDGSVAQRMDYDEFGNVLADTNPGFQPFGFQGGLYDRDTGLVRFGARDYDPKIGRWLTKDALGFEAGLNFYVFCDNDPVNFVDPLGLWGVQFGENGVNIGRGNPTLLFTQQSWRDAGGGAAAFVDGVVPFADPLAKLGAYDANNPAFQASQAVGSVTREVLAVISGGGIGTLARAEGLTLTAGQRLLVGEFGPSTVGLLTGELTTKGLYTGYAIKAAGRVDLFMNIRELITQGEQQNGCVK